MSIYPKSPKQMTAGIMYFPRVLDKIRLHARGELSEDYHPNLGHPTKGDGVLCNFLRVKFDELTKRVQEGGTDEEVLEWCYTTGRRLNEGDIPLSGMLSSRSSAGMISQPRGSTRKSKSTGYRIGPMS
jgi:hypothetical protein